MSFLVSIYFSAHRFRCDIYVGCPSCEEDLKFYLAIAFDAIAASLWFAQ